jgi:hypothetical protein
VSDRKPLFGGAGSRYEMGLVVSRDPGVAFECRELIEPGVSECRGACCFHVDAQYILQ